MSSKSLRLDTLAAFAAFLTVDLVLAAGGFSPLHRLLQRRPVARRTAVDIELEIARVNAAVDRAAIWYPRPAQCLPRSAVGTWLLRRKGVAATMVIGVRKMPFYAHAWIEVDGRVVNDVPQVQTRYPAIDRITPRTELRS